MKDLEMCVQSRLVPEHLDGDNKYFCTVYVCLLCEELYKISMYVATL